MPYSQLINGEMVGIKQGCNFAFPVIKKSLFKIIELY